MTTATNAYAELAAAIRGDLIMPGDARYDQAGAVYNAMIDKHPAAIARCRDTAGVITCVRLARDRDTEVAVRGGGHSAAGLGERLRPAVPAGMPRHHLGGTDAEGQ
jgi:FAD/FMN-containing dehydrogenase